MTTSQAAGAPRWARLKVMKLRAQALRAVWRGDPDEFRQLMGRVGEVQGAATEYEGYCKWRAR